MKILVTNDDGITAIGIRKLVCELKKIAEIVVVAPDKERSASGHAITIHTPLRIERDLTYEKGIEAWSVSGTPSDCVKIALESILGTKPDLVISGINNGPNLGTDVIYSGTVSAAIEAAIHGIPSIAFSIAGIKEQINYESAVCYSCKLINLFFNNIYPKSNVLNINVPSLVPEKIKGLKITELGIRRYENTYEKREDPRGKTYYWLSGSLMTVDNRAESDVCAIEDDMISVTPLHYDLTNYQVIKELKNTNIRLHDK